MNYQECYIWGSTELAEADIYEAKLDARLLLEFVCQTNRNTLFVHPDREVSETEYNSYVNCINERKKRIPLQHITGVQDFMGLEFIVNENVLIPRQDTELLVEEAMLQLHDGMSVLDMCTGSGCIVCSLLKYSNDCVGVGVDLSDKALEVAKKNAKQLGINSVSFMQSNLFEKVEGKFDLIVSNPPYIKTDVIHTLMPEVREYEPHMALDGLEDGLYFYREIIVKSKEHLYNGGKLFFEIGYDQGEDVCELMRQNGFKEVTLKKDYAGLDRVVFGEL